MVITVNGEFVDKKDYDLKAIMENWGSPPICSDFPWG